MFRPISPKQQQLLSKVASADTFGASAALRGRMSFLQSPSSPSIFIGASSILVPLQPSKQACNVYGSVHGGALWSFSDFVTSLHLQLTLNHDNHNDHHNQEEPNGAEENIFRSMRVVHASCRYHNGVAEDSKIVCKSTIVSLNKTGKTVHFYVDLIPEKNSPMMFDDESKDWKLKDNHFDVIPEKTFTRAVFTKTW